MRAFDEAVLRKHGDEPTGRALDLWHTECLSRIKKDLPVLMGDRRQNPTLRDIPGSINTAAPELVDGKWHLVLWFDAVNPLDPLLVTHELGHWILVMRGHKHLVDSSGNYGDTVANLNSLAQHPPLFKLQRSLGHEPQPMIDLKASNDLEYLNTRKERDQRFWIADALFVSDDLLNCSTSLRLRINTALKKRCPNIGRIVRAILDTIDIEKLDSPDANMKFCHRLTKVLRLGTWTELDPIPVLSDSSNAPTPIVDMGTSGDSNQPTADKGQNSTQ